MTSPHEPLGAQFPVILQRAQRGDEAAFGQLWRALNPAVVRYLRGMAGQEAEDLAAETWIGVVKGLKSFSGNEGAWKGWVFTIARRRWVDWCRVKGVKKVQLNDEVDDVGAVDDVDIEVLEQFGLNNALQLLQHLPEDTAEIIMLRVIADLDVAQVAEITGKNPGAVRVIAHRGLNRLAKLLQECNEVDDEYDFTDVSNIRRKRL